MVKAGVIDVYVFGFCSEGMEILIVMFILGCYNFGRCVLEFVWICMFGEDDLVVRTMFWKFGDKTIVSLSNVYIVFDSGMMLIVLLSVMYYDFMIYFNEMVCSVGLSVVVRGIYCFYEN